jgi:DNA-binding NarL/FixJ family response regulator
LTGIDFDARFTPGFLPVKSCDGSMIKLFVIDDHFLIIEGLCSSFDLESGDFMVIGSSLSVDEAIPGIKDKKPDIILLDLFIRQADPVLNLITIQQAFPSIPVVILSNESCISWQVEMFRHGVRAYINKGDDKAEMCQKLLQVYAGDVILPEEVAGMLWPTDSAKNALNEYSETRRIIEALSQGMTVKEIASKMELSESSIEKKLQYCRKIYHASTNTELVYKALIHPSNDLSS